MKPKCPSKVALALVTALVISGASLPVAAHETDHVTIPPGREFADHGAHLDRLFYEAIVGGMEQINRRVASTTDAAERERLTSPDEVAAAVNGRFPPALFLIEGLDAHVLSSTVRSANPGHITGYKPVSSVRRYVDIPLNPLNAWGCANIKVHGVYLGTDKIGHFTDMGMHYFRAYRAALRDGADEEAALADAVSVGTHGLVMSERGILGNLTAGAFSNADLAANYMGMQFYRNLTEPVMLKGELRGPLLIRQPDGTLRLAPHVSPDSGFFGWYVSDHYDEMLNPSTYLPHMRSGIARAMADHAEALVLRYRDDQGRVPSRQEMATRTATLARYWGIDYGHEGEGDELVRISDVCYAPDGAVTNSAVKPGVSIARAEGVDAAGRTPLHRAVLRRDVAELGRLIATGDDISAPDALGLTPLHLAARLRVGSAVASPDGAGDRIAGALIAAGADLSAACRFGRTPAHDAAASGSVATLGRLIDSGALPDASDHAGVTPLHLAAAAGKRDVAAMLVRHGASPDTPAGDGRTPREIALALSRQDVAALFERAVPSPGEPSLATDRQTRREGRAR